MTVKELIEQNRHSTLEMMTPGGFVHLTVEQANSLFCGGDAAGHPGDPEYSIKIPTDELLAQEVQSAEQDENGVWRFLTVPHDHTQDNVCAEAESQGVQILC